MSRPESYDEKGSSEEKRNADVSVATTHHLAFRNDQVDTGAQLVAGGIEIDAAEALRIRKKIDWHILPLMCSECTYLTSSLASSIYANEVLYWIQFMDKTTLGASAILGIRCVH